MAERREFRRRKRGRGADALALEAPNPVAELQEYVADLAYALLERDSQEIRRLLREPISARLPLEVRAEATQFMRLPGTSVRAPIHTLRYSYRLHELYAGTGASGDDPHGQLELFSPERSW